MCFLLGFCCVIVDGLSCVHEFSLGVCYSSLSDFLVIGSVVMVLFVRIKVSMCWL